MADLETIERLRAHAIKRIETTMIGSLSKFENNFGFLWGHDIEDESLLSPEQIEFLDLWERTRNQILNNGNQQIRDLKDDFYRYGGVFRQSYYYNFGKPKE